MRKLYGTILVTAGLSLAANAADALDTRLSIPICLEKKSDGLYFVRKGFVLVVQ